MASAGGVHLVHDWCDKCGHYTTTCTCGKYQRSKPAPDSPRSGGHTARSNEGSQTHRGASKTPRERGCPAPDVTTPRDNNGGQTARSADGNRTSRGQKTPRGGAGNYTPRDGGHTARGDGGGARRRSTVASGDGSQTAREGNRGRKTPRDFDRSRSAEDGRSNLSQASAAQTDRASKSFELEDGRVEKGGRAAMTAGGRPLKSPMVRGVYSNEQATPK
jgi:hypothetical protein